MNEPVLYVNGEFVKKSEAVISVYDSGFQHGDGIYEGIRVYNNKVFMLDEHIDRLYESAKTISIDIGVSKSEMREIVLNTLRANKGLNDIHIRLQVTRGRKSMTGMNPKLNETQSSIVVCLEQKKPIFNKEGISLITSSLRRYPPNLLDPKIHSCNQLNQILASIEANNQNADEAIMLDINGFVAETNSTTIFMVKDNVLYTPTTNYILPGITRKLLLEAAVEENIKTEIRDITLHEFYNADEVFICGTVGEIVPVKEIDHKLIRNNNIKSITEFLMKRYKELTDNLGVAITVE